MFDLQFYLTALVVVVGFYAAWNIGANDVANAMGTSVGSGALTLKQAVIIAGVFEFLGAFMVGANVSETVRKKMFDPEFFQTIYGQDGPLLLALAMIAALMAAGTWLMFASYRGWPVSTTHSIVGAVVGVGAVALGVENIAWGKVALITAGWVVSPLLSGIVAFVMFKFLLKSVFHKEDPVSAAKKIAPYLSFMVLLVLAGVVAFKGLKPLWKTLKVDPSDSGVLFFVACAALGVAFIGMLITRQLVGRIRPVGKRLSDTGAEVLPDSSIDRAGHSEMQAVERIFAGLQILTASIVAFAHGSNDVANAVGPMSAAYQAISTGEIGLQADVPPWMLALGGAGIVTGLAMWGWRVIETVGKRITELTPSRGFVSEFSAAIVILMASVMPLGLPVSTTHTLVGAVIGVGLARGFGAIDLSVAKVIVTSWMITIPAGATLSIGFYFMLKSVIL